jgi:hypothetical protein
MIVDYSNSCYYLPLLGGIDIGRNKHSLRDRKHTLDMDAYTEEPKKSLPLFTVLLLMPGFC